MLRLIVRVVLTAILFCFVFPKVSSGTAFHGQFWPDGVIYAAVFAVVAYIVNVLIRLAAGVFCVTTFGLGLLIIIPALLLGFWLIPAVQLQVFAHYFPEKFSVAGWSSAIWAGLLLMIVNMMTASPSKNSK